MTRIPAVSPDEAGPLVKLSYRRAKRRFGEVPEPFPVTAQAEQSSEYAPDGQGSTRPVRKNRYR